MLTRFRPDIARRRSVAERLRDDFRRHLAGHAHAASQEVLLSFRCHGDGHAHAYRNISANLMSSAERRRAEYQRHQRAAQKAMTAQRR